MNVVHILSWWKPKPNGFQAVKATLDTLDRQARLRCDTRAIAKLHEARVIITSECLKASRGGKA